MDIENKAEIYIRNKHRISKDTLSACIRQEYKDEFDAYIIGAKENGLKWHDLRENPDDLPNDCYNVLDQSGSMVYYDFDKYTWRDASTSHKATNVFAWSEIPMYTELDNVPYFNITKVITVLNGEDFKPGEYICGDSIHELKWMFGDVVVNGPNKRNCCYVIRHTEYGFETKESHDVAYQYLYPIEEAMKK